MTTPSPPSKTTTAFSVQSMLSFAVALTGVSLGIWAMPVDPWIRAFLGLGTLYVVTSTFTLAKIVRDQQDATSVLQRVDQARLERMLADYDPYRSSLPSAPPAPPQAPATDPQRRESDVG